MTNATHPAPATIAHVFSHMGAPPYRFIGFKEMKYQACQGAPVQPGSSCDHCGTGIIDVYFFRSSDGKEFHVGSSCVLKSGDRGLIDLVKREENKVKLARRHAAEAARIEAARVLLARDDIRAALKAQPHPGASDEPGNFHAGRTALDWADWMMQNAGNAGRMKVARKVEKMAEA